MLKTFSDTVPLNTPEFTLILKGCAVSSSRKAGLFYVTKPITKVGLISTLQSLNMRLELSEHFQPAQNALRLFRL